MDYRVGFCQYKPELMKPEQNIERLAQLLQGVAADLLVFPELALSGYVFRDKEELINYSEPTDSGRTVDFFRQFAKENDVSCVVGFPERVKKGNDTIVYNSCFLANPDGSYYVYRKIHLFNREKLMFTPGDGDFSVYPAKKGVRIGMMVCFDWIFPESARTLALKGAQIICHPANLVLPWCQQAMITRSLENRLFTITSNRVGDEVNGEIKMSFTGQSQVTATKGEVLKRFDTVEEGIWITTINPEEADDKMVTPHNHAMTDRRPDKYFD